jgi:hypothetical protein
VSRRIWISAEAERALAAFCLAEMGGRMLPGRESDGTIVIGEVAFQFLSAIQQPGETLSDVMVRMYHFNDPNEEMSHGEVER